jgi:nicotinamidase-related amidase
MDYTSPDPLRCALVTIDMQKDFALPDASAEIPGTLEVVPTIRRVLDAFRKQNRPILGLLVHDVERAATVTKRASTIAGRSIPSP